MKLSVKKPFAWAHRGVEVKHYEAGDEIDTNDQDLIKVSTEEGWTKSKGKAAPENRNAGNAPENKAAGDTDVDAPAGPGSETDSDPTVA